METAEFDFSLPHEMIALRPPEKRDRSRLLVLFTDGRTEHRYFSDIPAYLAPGDLLVLNDTRVFPARIIARKPSGGRLDILLVGRDEESGEWDVLCRSGYRGPVLIGGDAVADIGNRNGTGCDVKCISEKYLKFRNPDPVHETEIIESHGLMPLPPYIRRLPDESDRTRYQTVYAEKTGSIAAPTAGLHFTAELLSRIGTQGVTVRKLTLHVGIGTFRPVRAKCISEHTMDAERYEIPASLIGEIMLTKQAGGRVITVGTTVTRALEGIMQEPEQNSGKSKKAVSENGMLRGATGIFIRPGHHFVVADAVITNFHLPRSTPLMLAAAFSGLKNLLHAYREAIALGYRFFSYGDAMLMARAHKKP